jgi:hypothetical protein
MAQILSVNVYGANGFTLASGTNQTWGFPTQNIIIKPSPTLTLLGVPMLTVIQMLPAGTKAGQDQFFSPTATATVITAANS